MRGLCWDCRYDKHLLITKDDAKRKYYLIDEEIDKAKLFTFLSKYIIDEIEDLAEEVHSKPTANRRRQKRYIEKKEYVSRVQKMDNFIRDNILEPKYRDYIKKSRLYKEFRKNENISFVHGAEEIMAKYRRRSARDYETEKRIEEINNRLLKRFSKDDINDYIYNFIEYDIYVNEFCTDLDQTVEKIEKRFNKENRRDEIIN
jgi:hypothetical protein